MSVFKYISSTDIFCVYFHMVNDNMNQPAKLRAAHTPTTMRDYHICPCCNLIRNIYSFIDPRNFSCNVICNNCLFGLSSFTQNNLYSTTVYPSTQPSTQTIKNQTVKKTTNTNQQIHSGTVLVSSWSVVPIAKDHKQKNVYTARLIHHRLYKKYCSSI